MNGLNLTTKDLQRSSNPAWRQAAGGSPDAPKPRAKRFTGPTAQSKAWARKMSEGPGRFFQTARIPIWLNSRMHPLARAKIVKVQRWAGEVETGILMTAGIILSPPYLVTLTRYGPKVLDADEAVAASLKGYRDGVADWLGIDDGDVEQLRFVYRQESAKWYGIRIVVEGSR